MRQQLAIEADFTFWFTLQSSWLNLLSKLQCNVDRVKKPISNMLSNSSILVLLMWWGQAKVRIVQCSQVTSLDLSLGCWVFIFLSRSVQRIDKCLERLRQINLIFLHSRSIVSLSDATECGCSCSSSWRFVCTLMFHFGDGKIDRQVRSSKRQTCTGILLANDEVTTSKSIQREQNAYSSFLWDN